MNTIATVTARHYNLKPGTKTVWVEDASRLFMNEIDATQYNNIVDAAPFFRRLGGSETLHRTYTKHGYRVYEIISKSPDRTMKTVRTFDYI